MRLLALFTATVLAQSPAFEAASIKPANSGRTGHGINVEGARIRVVNSTLMFCVQIAWNVKDFQVTGGPSWADKDVFDIDAVAAKPFEGQEYRSMLKAMLVERFDLKIHTDTQDRPGFALVVSKPGRLSPPTDDPNMMMSHTPTGDVTLAAKSASMSQLASLLSANLGQPVADRTGLDGKFDVSLQWTPDRPVLSKKTGEPIAPPAADAIPGPTLFTALQEKLGLKLESKKVPMEVVVIDHAEHPTAN